MVKNKFEYKEDNLTKVGLVLEEVGGTALFFYWCLVPLFTLVGVLAILSFMTGINFDWIVNLVSAWLVGSIVLIGIGSFIKEIKGSK